MNPVPHFVSVPSLIIVNPVPYSNLSDPSGGSVIYESGTGEISCYFQRVPIQYFFFIWIRGLRFFMADRLLGTGSAVTDLKRTSDPVFFYGSVPLDLSF